MNHRFPMSATADLPPPPPPPIRREPRRLSLKNAIAAATRRESAGVRPFVGPEEEFPAVKSKSGKQQEMEAHLIELQADISNREELLSEREKHLESRELELNEREALLDAHRKVFASKSPKTEDPGETDVDGELAALKALQEELESQEASLKEARRMLHEREAFIEKCENELVETSMLLTEREARIEQREEDSGAGTESRIAS